MQHTEINGTFKETLPWSDVFETESNRGLMLWRITLEPNGNQHLEVSAALLKLVGRSPEECPKCWDEFIADFVHPEDWKETSAAFHDCVRRPRVAFHFEHRLFHAASGQWRWARATAQGKKINRQGLATEIFGGTLDVHYFYAALNDLQKAHRDLRRQRRRLASIINASDIVVWDWDLEDDERIYDLGWGLPPTGETESGNRSSQCIWEQLLASKDKKRAKREAEGHARGEAPFFEMAYRVPRPNGSKVWLQDRGQRVDQLDDGQSCRLRGVMTDITNHKKREHRLRKRGERLDLIIRATKIGAWDWNVGDNQVSFNEPYARMMGYSPGELDGSMEKWRGHVHPEDLDRLNNHFISDSINPDLIYESTVRMRHKNGHYINTYSMGRVVGIAENGRTGRVVGIQFEPHKGLVI